MTEEIVVLLKKMSENFESQPNLEKEYLLTRKIEVREELELLREMVKSRVDEIKELESQLRDLEMKTTDETVVIDLRNLQDIHESTDEASTYRKFLHFLKQNKPDFDTVRNSAVGAVAGGGGLSGLYNNPEAFIANLGFSVTAGLAVGYLEKVKSWIEYKNATRKH